MRRMFALKKQPAPSEEGDDGAQKRARVETPAPEVPAPDEDAVPEGEGYAVLHAEICEDIRRHYASLLSPSEHRTLSAFLSLSRSAQRLWSRLVGRKYRVFRVSSLSSDDCEAALLELVRARMLSLVSDGRLHLDGNRPRALALLRLCRVHELRTVAASVSVVGRDKMPRSDLLELLAALCGGPDAPDAPTRSQSLLSFAPARRGRDVASIEAALVKVLRGAAASTGAQPSLEAMWGKKKAAAAVPAPPPQRSDSVSAAWVQRHGYLAVLGHAVCALFDRVELLYFLDQSDMKSLILAKVSQHTYPRYVPNRHGVPFKTREQLVEYLAASNLLRVFLDESGLMPQSDANGKVSDDVPIPGRSWRPPSLPEDFCRVVALQTAMQLHADGAVDVALDPLGGVGGFAGLEEELQRHAEALRQRPGLTTLMSDLMAADDAPLSVFEAGAVAESDGCDDAPPLHVASQPSQEIPYMRRFRREYVLLYLLRFGVDYLEKCKDYEAAVLLLRVLLSLSADVRQHALRKMGHFWLRLSLDVVHWRKDRAAAHAVAVRAVDGTELSLAASIRLKQRIVFLAKGLRLTPLPQFAVLVELEQIVHERLAGSLLRSAVGMKSLFESVDGDAVSVEEYVLQYYGRIGGWTGVHSEGSIWRTLAVLLLWERIYDSAVPHVFQTPCQTAPLDLYSPFFYLSRREALDDLIGGIRDGAVRPVELLRRNWDANVGCLCPVNWSAYSVDVLCTVLDSFSSSAALAELLLYAAKDFRGFSKGMPDLTMWRDRSEPRLLLSEVKGPRDRLSPEQEAHLIMLNAMGISAIVTHVVEGNSKHDDHAESPADVDESE